MDCIAKYLPTLLDDPTENFSKVHHYTRQLLLINPDFGVAHYVLGCLYETGSGVEKDMKLALGHFQKGAMLKDGKCIEKIGDWH